MSIEDAEYKPIIMGCINLDELLQEAKERINEKAKIDYKYRDRCKQLSKEHIIDKNYK